MKKISFVTTSSFFVKSIRYTSTQVDSIPSKYATTFKHSDLSIEISPQHKLKTKPKDVSSIKFGSEFSDHMMSTNWDSKNGWNNPEITPMKNFTLHPASKCLHYATQLFEGMKAYRGIDNKIRLFRPEHNMERMNSTAIRCALPTFDGEELIKIISELVNIDKEWVPYSDVASLYIRPTLVGTEGTLGVADSSSAKLFVITGPTGAYYPTGFKPISLLADSKYVRAFPGGVGQYKMGCNYAPTVMVGRIATDMGCQQVLWLYGENEDITEVGTMNLFVYWKNENGEDELITPSLSRGIILPGVTRKSLIELATGWNEFKISEKDFTMHQLKRALKEKRVYQIFGSGTACVVSPVGRILHRNKDSDNFEELIIPTMEAKNNVMQRLYTAIMDIQYGRVEKAEWTRVIS
ncbi:Branched-chain-amino-acid aminotransferase [Strongyloides ratti]|uniref:Branched-chain-amino-acid aminotransferase n=1 Tax=Strongyloides ratti TaxID=34506 RepID=A0A090KRY6_STRRB|nr:Branched-chain-amino-acid aminotransferase [Strongyloides ratti]CEF60250.1 Branched-chain-amino-acid aminotransferase [Strongyloides ratti]